MSPVRILALLVPVCGLLLAAAVSAQAPQHYSASPRQYYGGWSRHPQQAETYYRPYYYKPTPQYSGYKHHYVVYTPRRPQHLYYYNPYRKVYWGRCSTSAQGQPEYSHLAEGDRKETLADIPEAAFPRPGQLPPIPESDPGQNIRLDLPPDDLPAASTLPST